MSDREFYAHPSALVAATQIGENTRIWAFSNVQERAVVGADCNICDHCFIESGVVIGDRVTVKNGVSLWDGVVVEDDVFIGPNAVFTNDIYPRSKVYHDQPDRILIRKGATIGANAVIVAGHDIGEYAFVGAGAVVTRPVPAFTIWYGNPAVFAGYVCKCAHRIKFGDDLLAVCECGIKYRLVDGQVTIPGQQ